MNFVKNFNNWVDSLSGKSLFLLILSEIFIGSIFFLILLNLFKDGL